MPICDENLFIYCRNSFLKAVGFLLLGKSKIQMAFNARKLAWNWKKNWFFTPVKSALLGKKNIDWTIFWWGEKTPWRKFISYCYLHSLLRERRSLRFPLLAFQIVTVFLSRLHKHGNNQQTCVDIRIQILNVLSGKLCSNIRKTVSPQVNLS